MMKKKDYHCQIKFELQVKDSGRQSAENYVTVIKNSDNSASGRDGLNDDTSHVFQAPAGEEDPTPNADAGPDQHVNEGDVVKLDGSMSKGISYGSYISKSLMLSLLQNNLFL